MARKGASTLVGLSAPRVIVVPRWGGTPNDDWYPWIASELRGVTVLNLPNPPTVDAWVAGVATEIGDDPYALARTLVIGHSVGCRAVLAALAKLPSGRAVHSVLCIAGWWQLDEPWPEIQPFIDLDIDLGELALPAQQVQQGAQVGERGGLGDGFRHRGSGAGSSGRRGPRRRARRGGRAVRAGRRGSDLALRRR